MKYEIPKNLIDHLHLFPWPCIRNKMYEP